jgi:drug/metabolite transporter (DMT)-like permease
MSSVPGVDDRTESATRTAPNRGAAAADSALTGGVLGGAAPGDALLDGGLDGGALDGRPRRGRGAGLAFGLLSAAAFGTSGTFGSALIDAGWSPAGAVLARVSVAALVLTGPALVQLRGRWALLRRWGWRTVAYGFVGVATCQLGYFNAISRMPVGIALLLEYMGILLVVGWLWARHGQRPRRLTVAGGAAALGGLALMLDLSGAGGISPVGVLWALLAAVSMAIYFLLSAWSGAKPLPPVVMTWGGMVVGSVALAASGLVGLAPVTMSAADVTLFSHRVSWVVPVLGLSVLAAAFAYVTGIGAARRLGAKLGSFVAMAEVLFATAFAWVLLRQVPSTTQFLGGALILLGVVLVRLDEA